MTRRRIPFADAVAVLVVAHARAGLPFPTELDGRDDRRSRLHLEFASVEDLAQWLPFFGKTELGKYEQQRTRAGDETLRQDLSVVWRGWEVTLSAVGSRPAGPMPPLAAEVASIVDALDLPSETDPEFEAAHEAAAKIDEQRPQEHFSHRVTVGDTVLDRRVILSSHFVLFESYSRLDNRWKHCAADGGDLPAGQHGLTIIGKCSNLAEARERLAELRMAVPDADVIDENMITMPHWWFNHRVGESAYLVGVDTVGRVHVSSETGWQPIGRVDVAKADQETQARNVVDAAFGIQCGDCEGAGERSDLDGVWGLCGHCGGSGTVPKSGPGAAMDRPLHVRIVDELMPGISPAVTS